MAPLTQRLLLLVVALALTGCTAVSRPGSSTCSVFNSCRGLSQSPLRRFESNTTRASAHRIGQMQTIPGIAVFGLQKDRGDGDSPASTKMPPPSYPNRFAVLNKLIYNANVWSFVLLQSYTA
jgi:hypothetical protein